MSALQHGWYRTGESPEWTTPAHVLERVVRVLGSIDLDPCSDAKRSVPAERHYLATDDSLAAPWYGRVFCNPPYGRGGVLPRWVRKISCEVDCGNARELIALLPARTETAWFRIIWEADALCFWRGRLRFGESTTDAPFPSVLAYWGRHCDRFSTAFADCGKVVYP